MSYRLDGRVAIITGASQGLGRAIAAAYVDAGASVLVTARDATRLEGVADALRSRAAAGQRVAAETADVSRPADVRRLMTTALRLFPDIHILVNNAGVYGPMGPAEDVDWEAWVEAVQINLFGSVLMCRAVLPHFKRRGYGKVVQLSGGGATAPLPRFSAYAVSKAAIVRYCETLAGEVRDDGIDVNAIAPGALNTRLLDEVLAAGPAAVGAEFHERARRQKSTGGTPLERGAELAVFLGSSASDGVSGRLISAVWDPWPTLGTRAAALRDTDIYTLRRIVPRDRGLDWPEP